MQINEIFASIQGEGLHLGLPVVFIRTSGCNLHCPFCDTKETWNTLKCAKMSVKELAVAFEAAHAYKQRWVVITGGEPCIQKDLSKVIAMLHDYGMKVAIETNGTLPTPSNVDWVACSPKEEANYMINKECIASELKYVVTLDFDPDVITEEIRKQYADRIWLQPDGYHMKEAWQRCLMIAEADPRLRVGVQLHKIMEVK